MLMPGTRLQHRGILPMRSAVCAVGQSKTGGSPFSGGFRFGELKHLCLDRFQNRIPHISACIQDLYSDQFTLLIEFCSYVWTDFDAGDFPIVRDRQVEDIFFFKVSHVTLSH